MAKKKATPAIIAAQNPAAIVDAGFPLDSGLSSITLSSVSGLRTCGGCRHLDRGQQSCRRVSGVNEHSPICSSARFEWDVANGHHYLNRELLAALGKTVFQHKTNTNTRNLAAFGAMLLQVASKDNVLALAAWGLEPMQPVMFTFGRCYLSNYMPCYVLTATTRNIKSSKGGPATPTTVFQLANIDTGAVYESLGFTDTNCIRMDDWPEARDRLIADGLTTDPLLERNYVAYKAWAFGRSAATRSKEEDEGREAEYANALAEASSLTRIFELAAYNVLVRYSESVDTFDERGVVDALEEAAELCQNHDTRSKLTTLRNRFVRISAAVKHERSAVNRDKRFADVEVDDPDCGNPWVATDLLGGEEVEQEEEDAEGHETHEVTGVLGFDDDVAPIA